MGGSSQLVPIKSRMSVVSKAVEDSDIMSSLFISYDLGTPEEALALPIKESSHLASDLHALNTEINNQSSFLLASLDTQCLTMDALPPVCKTRGRTESANT